MSDHHSSQVLLAMLISWGVCALLTMGDVLPTDPGAWGSAARTDRDIDVLEKAKWFRFPYPGKEGVNCVFS